jgi:acetyl/propionyl-CoA carboxylase alpha subunit
MIAKLVVKGADRTQALAKLRSCLDDYNVRPLLVFSFGMARREGGKMAPGLAAFRRA